MSDPQPETFFFLAARQWLVGCALSLLPVAAFLPWYGAISPWIGGILFFATLTVYHMVYVLPFMLPFPHVAILISALQYILAAWLSFYYPHADPTYNIGQFSDYFAYAGPAILAVAVGWSTALSGLKPNIAVHVPSSRALLLEFDLLLVVGVSASAVGALIDVRSLDFVFVLASGLRYLGVFGRMVTHSPGWKWRLAVLFASEVAFAADTAMFHPLLLWSCWSGIVWMYCFKPRPRTVVAAMLIALVLLPALQEAKWRLRGESDDIIQGPMVEVQGDKLGRTLSWVSYLGTAVQRTLTLELDEAFVAETVARYNLGWIVNRTMQFVPDAEPFARGETIKDAITAAVLPRVIAGDKIQSGGQEYMLRFAGIQLSEATAMNLGFVGEMYANFGILGGIIGCGFYALALGLLFRWFAIRAAANPLWWCIVPFIFYSALKSEDGIADTIGWTTKSCFVMVGLYFLMPAFRRALKAAPMQLHKLHVAPVVALAANR